MSVKWDIGSAELIKAFEAGGHRVTTARQCPHYAEGGWPSYDFMMRCKIDMYDDGWCPTHKHRFGEKAA